MGRGMLRGTKSAVNRMHMVVYVHTTHADPQRGDVYIRPSLFADTWCIGHPPSTAGCRNNLKCCCPGVFFDTKSARFVNIQ